MWVMGHFSSAEFQCKCGCGAGSDLADIDDNLLLKLNLLRVKRAAPILLTSAARCVTHNTAEGGKTRSAHITIPGVRKARAVDIRCIDNDERFILYDLIRAVGFVRIGLAKTFLHVDVALGPDYPQGIAWFY